MIRFLLFLDSVSPGRRIEAQFKYEKEEGSQSKSFFCCIALLAIMPLLLILPLRKSCLFKSARLHSASRMLTIAVFLTLITEPTKTTATFLPRARGDLQSLQSEGCTKNLFND